MPIEQEYKKRNIEAQQHIKTEMEHAAKGLSPKDNVQLRSILDEVERMMETKHLAIYYPRTIVDSWDFDDELGSELLELADLYKQWR